MAEEGILHDGIYRVGDVRVSDLAGRKRLPIGDSVFESVVGNKVYIDKSMLIADVLDSGAVATLFCRPRRFGKSLNLSMLQRFLEIPNPNDIGSGHAERLFRGLEIWEADGGSLSPPLRGLSRDPFLVQQYEEPELAGIRVSYSG